MLESSHNEDIIAHVIHFRSHPDRIPNNVFPQLPVSVNSTQIYASINSTSPLPLSTVTAYPEYWRLTSSVCMGFSALPEPTSIPTLCRISCLHLKAANRLHSSLWPLLCSLIGGWSGMRVQIACRRPRSCRVLGLQLSESSNRFQGGNWGRILLF